MYFLCTPEQALFFKITAYLAASYMVGLFLFYAHYKKETPWRIPFQVIIFVISPISAPFGLIHLFYQIKKRMY